MGERERKKLRTHTPRFTSLIDFICSKKSRKLERRRTGNDREQVRKDVHQEVARIANVISFD